MKVAKLLNGICYKSYERFLRKSIIIKNFVRSVNNGPLTVSLERNLVNNLNLITSNFWIISERKICFHLNFSKTNAVSFAKFGTKLYPSHSKISLPALSPTMETGTILTWHKKEGDKISEGVLLADIETDKATMGFEAPEDGYLAKIILPAGSKNIPVGKLMCITVENEDDVASFKDYQEFDNAKDKPATPKAKTSSIPKLDHTPIKQQLTSVETAPKPTDTHVGFQPTTDRVFLMPAAKRLAQEMGLNLSEFNVNSGPSLDSALRMKDILNLKSTTKDTITPSPPVDYEKTTDILIDESQKKQAQLFLKAKTTIPHYYLVTEINLDNVKEFGNQAGVPHLKIIDVILKAAALACLKVPEVNSSWLDDVIRQYTTVDINIAMKTDNGFLTYPILYGVERKGLITISKELDKLMNKVKTNNLDANDLKVGTFSVYNFLDYGIRKFSAIIKLPQACILTIGSPVQIIVPDSTSEKGYKISTQIASTLSCDHRLVDGAIGAEWLTIFKKFLEKPSNMLLY